MDSFVSICAHGDNSNSVINDCLDQLEQFPTTVNFAFIYVSDNFGSSLESILQQCKFKTGIQHWVGSLGVGVISTGIEIYDQYAISILLCKFPDNEFNIIQPIKNSADLDSTLNYPKNSDSYFALMHVDAYNPESQKLLEQYESSIENCFIAGGITSSRDKQLQIANTITSDSISGVIFSDKIPVQTNLSQGCSPLGNKHTVTKSQDNVVITLDNKPALEVFYDDIGEILSRDVKRAAQFVFAALCIPHSDKSDYKVRNLVGIDEQQKVFAINDVVPEGEKILICKRDTDSAEKDMLKMLDNLKKRIITPIKGGVYISCLGRGREQFGDNSEEIKMIHNTLGDFPLTGFFANGEIHNKHIYGYTGVLTLFT